MKKITLAIFTILTISCARENPFLITEHSIGKLDKLTQIRELKKVFAKDSIANEVSGDEFLDLGNDIKIYDKQGNPLLILEAEEEFDSTSVIKTVRVMDSRFKTEKGLNINSTFKEVKEHYTISKITNTLSVAIVNIEELNAYIAINKKELPADLLFDTKSKIELTDIPDNAKIKYFFIDWEN